MYLFTDGEDLGPSLEEMFLGAKFFVKNMPAERPSYGILLDMIGDKDLRVPVEPNSLAFARDLTMAFYNLAKVRGFGSTFPMEEGPIIEDDHIPLNRAGIPTLDLIDFDYESWHTTADTADKCSADSLGKVGDMMVEWLTQNPPYVPKK
jgi:Zn-dependent M28 family amino/carboxypeptidase